MQRIGLLLYDALDSPDRLSVAHCQIKNGLAGVGIGVGICKNLHFIAPKSGDVIGTILVKPQRELDKFALLFFRFDFNDIDGSTHASVSSKASSSRRKNNRP